MTNLKDKIYMHSFKKKENLIDFSDESIFSLEFLKEFIKYKLIFLKSRNNGLGRLFLKRKAKFNFFDKNLKAESIFNV